MRNGYAREKTIKLGRNRTVKKLTSETKILWYVTLESAAENLLVKSLKNFGKLLQILPFT